MLSQPSDVSDLVPLHLVSIALLSPTFSRHLTNCLSQAYGCSDRYTWTAMVRCFMNVDIVELLTQEMANELRKVCVTLLQERSPDVG